MIQTTIGIDGMMCEMCETHINDAIRKNFTVKSAKSIRSVIANTGYDLLSITTEPFQKKKLFGLF